MDARCFVVAGAPASGKSTLVPLLVRRRTPALVVVDMDELLTGGALLGLPIQTPSSASRWPAYNALWSRLASLIMRSHVSVLLAGPLLPRELVPCGPTTSPQIRPLSRCCAGRWAQPEAKLRTW